MWVKFVNYVLGLTRDIYGNIVAKEYTEMLRIILNVFCNRQM